MLSLKSSVQASASNDYLRQSSLHSMWWSPVEVGDSGQTQIDLTDMM